MKFAVCLSNEGYEVDLEPFKVYQVIEDKEADAMGCIRIIDDSGEDYLFSANRFERLALAAPQEARFNAAAQILAASSAHAMV
jgi:hypothetical protein